MKTYQKLPESAGEMGGTYVQVQWEIGEQLDDAGDGHCFFHVAEGESYANGRFYTFQGTATVVDGSIEEIEDVELIKDEPRNEK